MYPWTGDKFDLRNAYYSIPVSEILCVLHSPSVNGGKNPTVQETPSSVESYFSLRHVQMKRLNLYGVSNKGSIILFNIFNLVFSRSWVVRWE